jgi:hypothetical protein
MFVVIWALLRLAVMSHALSNTKEQSNEAECSIPNLLNWWDFLDSDRDFLIKHETLTQKTSRATNHGAFLEKISVGNFVIEDEASYNDNWIDRYNIIPTRRGGGERDTRTKDEVGNGGQGGG